eukprot:COSAG06_NODE_52338_length_306_cov_0.859903_1_plen_92_part_01
MDDDLDYIGISTQLQQHGYTWSMAEEPSGMMTLRSTRRHTERIRCVVIDMYRAGARDPKNTNSKNLAAFEGWVGTIEEYDPHRGSSGDRGDA